MKHARLLLGLFALTTVAIAQPADLLLVAADDATLQPVRDRMSDVHHEVHAAWELWRGQCAGKTIVLTRSEGDPLNAVAATAIAIHFHRPRLVVVFGTSRHLDPALHPGDEVVSDRFVAFDGMVSPVTPLDHGSHPLRWEKLPHLLLTAGEKEVPADEIPADQAAIRLALHLVQPGERVVMGVVGSANQVNREADRIAWLRSEWHASSADTESAHVAGCAALLGVPAIGFRVMDGSGAEAAAFTLRFVEGWR